MLLLKHLEREKLVILLEVPLQMRRLKMKNSLRKTLVQWHPVPKV
jgi:hypothetical protein